MVRYKLYINNMDNFIEARRRNTDVYGGSNKVVNAQLEYQYIIDNINHFERFCEKNLQLKWLLMRNHNNNNLTDFNISVDLFLRKAILRKEYDNNV